MDGFRQDFRYALRRLARAPGLTAISILVLALGIGANTAFFSLVNSILKPAPIDGIERLVNISATLNGTVEPDMGLTVERVARLRRLPLTTVDGLFTVNHRAAALQDSDRAEIVQTEAVTGEYFQTLNVRPVLGRLLRPSDDEIADGATGPIVISERLWKRRYNGGSEVFGRTLYLSGQPVTVVGIAPATWRGVSNPNLFAVDVWVPRAVVRSLLMLPRGPIPSDVFGRLRPGVRFTQARAEIAAAGKHIDPARPEFGLTLLPGAQGLSPPTFRFYAVLFGTVIVGLSGLVLVIAGANVTCLFLARASSRASEMAVRMALGASRRRLMQLHLIETGIVTGAAGVAGVGVAAVTGWALAHVAVPEIKGVVLGYDPSLDVRVFAYAFLIVAGTAAIIGLIPAAWVARLAPQAVFAATGGQGGSTRRGRRLRTGLVASQVGASVVLLLAAGLYIRATRAALAYDPGIDTVHTAIGHFDFVLQHFDEAEGRRLYRTVLSAVAGAARIERAALASGVPAVRDGTYTAIETPEQHLGLWERGVDCRFLVVSPGYFEVLGVAWRAGRDFATADDREQSSVVIVNESVALALWPQQNPIGKRLRLGKRGPYLRVIGVVADTDRTAKEAGQRRFIFLPFEQRYHPRLAIIARGTDGGLVVRTALKTAVQRATPELAMFDVKMVAEEIGLTATTMRLIASILSALGGVGVAVTMLGLYGVVAYVVSLRLREFGIMRALGATKGRLYGLVVRDGLRMVAAGLVPGVIVAFLGAGLLTKVLVGATPHDALTFLVVPAGLAIVAAVASLVPARRAARVDVNVTLKTL